MAAGYRLLLSCGAIFAVALAAADARAAAGALDPGFGAGGTVLTDFGVHESARALALQPDGRIVAAGLMNPGGGDSDFALARYDRNGSLDAGFGSGGRVVTDFGPSFGSGLAVALQPDGKIVAGGAVGGDFGLARYNADGSLDPSFGSGGKVRTDLSAGHEDFVTDVAVQSDGRIVAAGTGWGHASGGPDFALARYNPGGGLDVSFGTGGIVLTDLGSPDLERLEAVVLEPDGRIVGAGQTRGAEAAVFASDFALARWTADGGLDPTFGSGGKVVAPLAPGRYDVGEDLALQPDGKIVVAGWSNGGFASPNVVTLARFDAGGALDAGFGTGGIVVGNPGTGTNAAAFAVALQPDGSIVVAGSSGHGFVGSFLVARYHADGGLDPGFGSGGGVVTGFGRPGGGAFGVAVQPDGRIVAAGQTSTEPDADFALARYLADAVEVTVDIKPGDGANPINLSSGGLVPVAVLTTAAFDAAGADARTICFGDDDHPSERDCTEAHGKGHREDVNRDGRLDLVIHFEVAQTGIDQRDTRACVTGTTFRGASIEGCDAIRTLRAKGR